MMNVEADHDLWKAKQKQDVGLFVHGNVVEALATSLDMMCIDWRLSWWDVRRVRGYYRRNLPIATCLQFLVLYNLNPVVIWVCSKCQSVITG
jgi:hypothetical protein